LIRATGASLADWKNARWQNRAHFFAIAHVLGVSIATVRRDWSLARAWLYIGN
jgi:hypothetical protein